MLPAPEPFPHITDVATKLKLGLMLLHHIQHKNSFNHTDASLKPYTSAPLLLIRYLLGCSLFSNLPIAPNPPPCHTHYLGDFVILNSNPPTWPASSASSKRVDGTLRTLRCLDDYYWYNLGVASGRLRTWLLPSLFPSGTNSALAYLFSEASPSQCVTVLLPLFSCVIISSVHIISLLFEDISANKLSCVHCQNSNS